MSLKSHGVVQICKVVQPEQSAAYISKVIWNHITLEMCSLLNGNNGLGLAKHQFKREMRVCMVRRTFLSGFFVFARFTVHEAVLETPTQNICMVTLCSLLILLIFSSAPNYMNSLLFYFLFISKFPAV